MIFNEGDLVRIIDEENMFSGYYGIVTCRSNQDYSLRIYNQGIVSWFSKESLEFVSPGFFEFLKTIGEEMNKAKKASSRRIEYLETRDELLRERMDQLEDELAEARRETTGYRKGNTELLSALMGMCYQYLLVDEDSDYCHHDFISAGENALSILSKAGLAVTKDESTYVLLWGALEMRGGTKSKISNPNNSPRLAKILNEMYAKDHSKEEKK